MSASATDDAFPALAVAAAQSSGTDPDDADDTDSHYRARARTVSIKRLSKRELERGRIQNPPLDPVQFPRPRKRGDCLTAAQKIAQAEAENRRPRPDELVDGCNAIRPCPWVSCPEHLYLDVSSRTGSIKLNFPDLEVWDLPETCGLDIADRGGITLEETGEHMNLTRERIRQLETHALDKIRNGDGIEELADLAGPDVPLDALTRKRRRGTRVDDRDAVQPGVEAEEDDE